MTSNESSTNPPYPMWKVIATEHADKMSRILNWARLNTVESSQREAEDQAKNREAESARVRQVMWGENAGTKDDDEMRQTILGDVTHPAPIIMPQQQSSAMSTVLAGLLGAAIPAAGVAGYIFSKERQPETPEQAQFDDTTVQIGLGRIEDYIQQ